MKNITEENKKMKIDLKDYKRTKKHNGRPKTINLTEKAYKKIKSKNINLSLLVNDFISNNDKKFLELEFNERMNYGGIRQVSTIYLSEENIKKTLNVKLSHLVNKILSEV